MLRQQGGVDASQQDMRGRKPRLVIPNRRVDRTPRVREERSHVDFVRFPNVGVASNELNFISIPPLILCELQQTERRIASVIIWLDEEDPRRHPYPRHPASIVRYLSRFSRAESEVPHTGANPLAD